jgi:hypothetical protein
MTNEKKLCPKCTGQMVRGFVPDNTHGGIMPPHWYEGAAKRGFMGGTRLPSSTGLPVGAFRCRKCGLIEFYAGEEFALEKS